ncbi:hypothetical protein O6H91_21G016000 [Diphasiastrum complanatum]|uniref:Uncharacterized protein n=1 Tax=Diphasiastrum complanatum TaxID=34168 RepID=A0ACC2AI54_DIPCM|nr:hypothetical protein O6H91_21G016000 [Diphasiastrum complanatum]
MAASSSIFSRLVFHLRRSSCAHLSCSSSAFRHLTSPFSTSPATSQTSLPVSFLGFAKTNIFFRGLPEVRVSECAALPPCLCGRGDKKTKKGKRFKGSFGKRRPDRGNQIRRLKTKWELPTDAPLPLPHQVS